MQNFCFFGLVQVGMNLKSGRICGGGRDVGASAPFSRPCSFPLDQCQNESLLGAEFWSFRICPSWYLGENSAVTLSVLSLRSSNLSFSTLSNFHQLRKKIWLRPKKNRCIKDRKKWNECASGIRVVTLVLLSPIERSCLGQET